MRSTITEFELREYEELKKQAAAVAKMHRRKENPRHGCCAKPKLCNGHKDECRSTEHGLDRVPWPCPTLKALGVRDDTDFNRLLRRGS